MVCVYCTTWYLKAYRFCLSSVYFGRYHFLTIIFILVNTSRCNLHANKIFWNSHLSFRLFWDFCSQKSIKMMVNFESLIFGDKRAVFFCSISFDPCQFEYILMQIPFILCLKHLNDPTKGTCKNNGGFTKCMRCKIDFEVFFLFFSCLQNARILIQ